MSYIQLVIQIKKKTELMLNSINKSGFSLLELVIVFALIGMLGAFVVPNIFRTRQGTERKEFVSSLETMLKNAVLESIVQNKVHQIYFDIEKELIELRVHDSKSTETKMKDQFVQIKDADFPTNISFLKKINIKNFFINGSDEVSAAAKLQDVLFYIMPDGTSQAVIINFVDEGDDTAQDVNFSLVINPFYARMSVHETFQTP